MKNKLFLFLMLLVLLMSVKPIQTRASHAAGGEIIYEWIQDSTYRIFFKFYRDCSGIAADTGYTLCMSNTCVTSTLNVHLSQWTGALPGGGNNGTSVSAGCSQYKNSCDSPGSTLPGYQEWWFSSLITMPYKCNFWRFSVSVSARNTSQNINGGNLYIETIFNNAAPGFDINSSPYFSIKPIPYCCINTPYSYNNGAIDPDGDSLVTDIIRPLDGGSCGPGSIISWKAGSPAYSLPLNPMQTNNTFVTNSATGQLSFTPALLGAHTLTTRVSEYRRGILVGYIMRDVQVQVLNCTNPTPKYTDTPIIVGGSYGTAGTIYGCVNQNLQFDFSIKSPDTSTVLLADDNHKFSIPLATIVYTNTGNDSIHGHFSWTPGVLDAGPHNLIVTAKDSTCKPPGIMLYFQHTYPIYIWPPIKAVPDTSVCPGETAYLNVSGGGNYIWSVLPGGSPITSLSCTNCPAPVATPSVLTSYVVLSQQTAFCNNSKDTVTVAVLPGLNFSKINDTITCPQNSVVLDLKVNPPIGVTYKAKWTPATYLNSDTLTATTSTPNKTTTYRVMLTSSLNKCKAYDTVVVDVLKGFSITNNDTTVCDGKTVQVNATGDSRYHFKWTSNSSSPYPFNNDTLVNPVITPSPVGTYTYMLKATYGSCRPDSLAFEIEVEPVPSVRVDDDAAMCENDTMRMHGSVIPNNFPFDLQWSPGASLNNSKILDPTFTAQQTTIMELRATTPKAKCTNADTVVLTVFDASFLFPKGDTAICPGTKTQLHLTGNGIKTFRWYPEVNISGKLATDPYVWPTTTTSYTVYGVDTNACFDTAYVKVVVHPGAIVQLPDSVNLYPGESYQMDPHGNGVYFSWFPNIGLNNAKISNPIAKPDVHTRYYVTAKTESGCTTTDSVNILVTESVVSVANAFTPGSSPNATFKVLRRGDATLKNFTIYNRWGQKVFETADIDKGWDGTFKGQAQPMGVYIYSIEAVTTEGRKYTKQGNVTLIR